MSVSYTYTDSNNYIDNLVFAYVETYSLQRGAAFEKENRRQEREYEKLEKRKEKYGKLTIEEDRRYLELDKLLGYTQYLLNSQGEFHFSSTKTNTFSKDSPEVNRLQNILKTKINEIPGFMCAPEYRDGIVFYNEQGGIISTLNVCLSCLYMETKMFNHLNADYETYDLLKKFFIDVGHDVEDPDYFIMDEIIK